MRGQIDYSRQRDNHAVVEGNRIGGRVTVADQTGDVTDPATGRVLATVPRSGPAEVELAVDCAGRAAPAWVAITPFERGRILARWAGLLASHQNELAATATAEMGKPLAESQAEVDRAVAEIEFMSGEATRTTG